MGLNQELEEKKDNNSAWVLRKTLAEYRNWLQIHADSLGKHCFDRHEAVAFVESLPFAEIEKIFTKPREITRLKQCIDESIEKAHLSLKQNLSVLQLDIRQCAFTLSHQKLPPIAQLDKQRRRIQAHLTHASKQLVELKSHQAVLEKKVVLLLDAFNPDTISLHIEHCRQQLQSSWTTHGMSRAMDSFFGTFANNLVEVQRQTNLYNDQLTAIYTEYSEDALNDWVSKCQLNLAPHIQALSLLQRQTGNFKRHYRTMLTHKNAVIQLFSDTLVKEAQYLFQQVFDDIIHWPVQAMTPLTHYWGRQKQQLTKQLIQVTHLIHQLEEEQQELLNLRVQLRAAHEAIATLESIRRELSEEDVVELSAPCPADILSSPSSFTAESYLAP